MKINQIKLILSLVMCFTFNVNVFAKADNDILINLGVGETWNHIHQTPRGGQIVFQVQCAMDSNPTPIPPQDLYFCAYNYTDYNWGIFTSKLPSLADSKNDVLSQCEKHNGQKCSTDFLKCEKEVLDSTYVSCTYNHGNYGTFFAEGETTLEAKTNVLILCENKNKADCSTEFVSCNVLNR